jgi:protein TonB
MLAHPWLAFFLGAVCLSGGLSAQESKTEPVREQQEQQQSQSPPQARISLQVAPGLLVKKVQPKYPKEARKKGVEGSVVMKAIISKTGDIEDLSLVSGDPLLVPSAMKAVKQWKYRPYILEGRPVEVDTRITVNFRLSH